jgi:hypothetical protein
MIARESAYPGVWIALKGPRRVPDTDLAFACWSHRSIPSRDALAKLATEGFLRRSERCNSKLSRME